MVRMYQTEWHGIAFASVTQTSAATLAERQFYHAFYDEFFRRYHAWEQLSPAWRAEKELVANFVVSRAEAGATVLSVGCGIGAVEHFMRQRAPHLDLFIHEVSPSAWRWIGAEFSDDRKLVGTIPDCLPAGSRFDLTYLSAVDYAMDDEALVGLLEGIRRTLDESGGRGECLLISASFEPTPETMVQHLSAFVHTLKRSVRQALAAAGVRSQGQFWGWTRTRAEYRAVMRRAGFGILEDGFIDHATGAYWIAGR